MDAPSHSHASSSRKLMASFENLVAVTNSRKALRDGPMMTWRDRGEPPVELHSILECLEHAVRGGIRAGTLGFMLRSGFNIVVLLFRIWKMPRQFRFSLIRYALFSQDSFRFAAMLGSFTAIYKFILNALPIILPPLPRIHASPSPIETPDGKVKFPVLIAPTLSERHCDRHSSRAETHWTCKQTRRWSATLAGAVAGGLGVMFEKRGRRLVIAQHIFVRGLQGSYNELSSKYGINIPHGDIILFSLVCGQIMYAFMMQPETIPHSFSTWINLAGKIPKESVSINRTLAWDGTFAFDKMQTLIDRPSITPGNRALLIERLRNARVSGDFGPRYAPCAAAHPWLDSCVDVPVDRFMAVFRWAIPMYGALHLIPAILSKWHVIWTHPLRMLARTTWGTIRSSAFLSAHVVIYQACYCYKFRLYEYLSSARSPVKLRKEWIDLLISRPSFWVGGTLTGLSLFIEDKRRRGEMAMNVLPKGLESAWVMARRKGYLFPTGEFGDALLCAIGMGMVMNTYQNNPQHLSGFVRRILYQFVGPN